jgi:dTDP-glucose 4,6-dehydratase
LILAWARTHGLPYIIVRPTNNYGIGQYVEKLIPKTCKYLHLGRKIPLHNNGTPVRTWLHAEDTARAIITIIESEVVNQIYNICGGFEQSNLETVTKLLGAYGYDTSNLDNYIDWSCSRPGQDVRYALDDSKLRSLGWIPIKKFDEEVPKIIQHYKGQFIW